MAYVDLAELAALTGRYDRAAAEVVFAPVAARLNRLYDERWDLGSEGQKLFQYAGAFDGRLARSLVDALPNDPPPPANPNVRRAFDIRHHGKAQSRLALARILGLPVRLRFDEPHAMIRNDDWLPILDD